MWRRFANAQRVVGERHLGRGRRVQTAGEQCGQCRRVGRCMPGRPAVRSGPLRRPHAAVTGWPVAVPRGGWMSGCLSGPLRLRACSRGWCAAFAAAVRCCPSGDPLLFWLVGDVCAADCLAVKPAIHRPCGLSPPARENLPQGLDRRRFELGTPPGSGGGCARGVWSSGPDHLAWSGPAGLVVGTGKPDVHVISWGIGLVL